MRTSNMDHSMAAATNNASSMTASRGSLPGYDSQSSHTYQSHSDRDRGSRASSVARSDANSDVGRYNKARKPIDDAVTSAFDEAQPQNAIPREILTQITEQITANVLQQLKATNLPTPVGQPTHTQPVPTAAAPTEHIDSSSSMAGSPPLDRSKVYTPPSPHRNTLAPNQISPTQSHHSIHSRRQPSPAGPNRGISPRPPVNQADDSDSKDERKMRPPAPQRISTSGDATVMEKCWGKLFVDGQCTQRLGQFLRGIAMHIIESYEPKHSLVITPTKLQKYYRETKVSREYYPWQEVFDDRTSSCSRMFRELHVEHHLISDHVDDRPDIPAMTPRGFETWMLLILRADPDNEFERLAYTALHMPIDNPDDKSERFPKELSRRLLPSNSDKLITQQVAKAMRAHCHVKLPVRSNSSSESDSKTSKLAPPLTTPGVSTIPAGQRHSYVEPSSSQNTSDLRRLSNTGRPPAPSVQDVTNDSAIEDEKDTILPTRPIERERKPYVAQPGGGKLYEPGDGVPLSKIQSQPPPLSHMPPVLPMDGRVGRSPSVTSTGRGQDSRARNAPVALHQSTSNGLDMSGQDLPPSSKHRSGSSMAHESRTVRNRSPSATRSARDYVHRSESDIKAGGYYSASSSGIPPSHYMWPDQRQDAYRPDHRASFSVDPRDGGREPRAKFPSVSSADGHRYYANDDEYYRQPAPGYIPDTGYSQYPPTAYRTK